MARLNNRIDSDERVPDFSTLLQKPRGANIGPQTKTPMEVFDNRRSPQGKTSDTENCKPILNAARPGSITQSNCHEKRPSKLRPLSSSKLANVNSLLIPKFNQPIKYATEMGFGQECPSPEQMVRSGPRKLISAPLDDSRYNARLSGARLSFSEENGSSISLSGFIVPDSASKEEALSSKCQSQNHAQLSPKKTARGSAETPMVLPWKSPSKSHRNPEMIGLTLPEKRKSTIVSPESSPECQPVPRKSDLLRGFSNSDDRFCKLRSSLPRMKSPYIPDDSIRLITPPSSPSKSTLPSPSKPHRIPPLPHMPSIDAFWSQEVINDWNEEYSPKKPLGFPRTFGSHLVDEDEDALSPSISPRKGLGKRSAKKVKEVDLKRKAFDAKKHGLATSFLAEIDHTVAQDQVAALAESTGGIKIIWNKKLSSTAGRANWRREHIRSKSSDSAAPTITHRHYAAIELAEKVIDDEDRLVNVVAHEYCHLATFMVSGVKDNPHGKEFKEWARKCTEALSHHNITVTTKHAYTITYKYIWTCTSCQLEYKRHSKSVDPSKHSCGKCKGMLVQIQPAPRKGHGEGNRSAYQEFVKKEHERARSENPGKGFGEIMAILGREFRESKRINAVEWSQEPESAGKESVDDLDSMVRKLNSVNLDS